MGISHNALVERGDRPTSFDVSDHPVPHGREEEWRFTPLERIKSLLEDVPSDAHLTWTTTVPSGVEVVELSANDARARAVSAPADRPAALAVAHSGGAVLVRIAAEAEISEPIVLRLHGEDRERVVWGHVLVELGHHSRATVVVEHTGSTQYSSSVSLRVGDGARLDFVTVQDWADDAVHAGHIAARVGRDATLQSFVVTLGGDLVRLVQTVDYDGPGGNAELLGMYIADAHQHLEHRLFVDHSIPHCRSNVTYKGALQGQDAHTVWIGDVLIRAAAEGTETFELNRNLVLTDGARADSVPNLEIETGEIVGAGHASATGRFDDEQLFYLQARGIPEDEARRLVVRGFFADVVQRMGIPELEERLILAIERELAVGQAIS